MTTDNLKPASDVNLPRRIQTSCEQPEVRDTPVEITMKQGHKESAENPESTVLNERPV